MIAVMRKREGDDDVVSGTVPFALRLIHIIALKERTLD
jgi:hypothetical protein